MMLWLSDKGFMPVDQYSTYTEADPAQADRGNFVTVKNVGASRKYIYTPYSADIPEGIFVNVNEDMNYLSMGLFGAKDYQYNEYSGDRMNGSSVREATIYLWISCWVSFSYAYWRLRWLKSDTLCGD